jgi:hypothetical protein
MTKENFANVINEDDLKWKMTSNRRLPQISKVKYLSNFWSDLPQILNLGLYDQKNFAKVSNEDHLKWKMTSNGRLPQISKVKYLSNYWTYGLCD